jgi:hypothetical protein
MDYIVLCPHGHCYENHISYVMNIKLQEAVRAYLQYCPDIDKNESLDPATELYYIWLSF